MKRERKKKRRQEKRKRKTGATRNRISADFSRFQQISGPSAPGRIVTTLPRGTHCEGIENFY